MPIPNTSSLSQRINKGSEGGNEFARLMNLALTAESKECDLNFFSFSDAQGDYKGVDSFIKYRNAIYTGFQYKFYPCPLSANHKQSIKQSLKHALDKFEELTTWVLITPDDFMKNDLEWFEELKKKNEFSLSLNEFAEYSNETGEFPKRGSLSLEHWGHTKIIELMLRHPHIGKHYFPEIFDNKEIAKFEIVKFGIDFTNCNWARFEKEDFSFRQIELKNDIHKTSDVVFDCQFINNTNNIELLQSIDVKVIEIWTRLKGIPSDKLLQSIGTIEIEVDFENEITTYDFEDPLIFQAKSPQRFKIQLVNFVEKCPGNCARICLSFNFSSRSIDTKEIYLSF